MAAAKDCPKCGLVNPPEAQRCDCGWDFVSRRQEQSYLEPKQRFGEEGDRMRHRIGLAVVCLHISAVLYLLVGLLMFPLFLADDHTGIGLPLAVGMFVFCLALIAGVEFVAFGLGRRKFWAWVAGLCIFGTYAPSLFFPLGVLGLWGLLDRGSRAEFGVGGPQTSAEPSVGPEPRSGLSEWWR